MTTHDLHHGAMPEGEEAPPPGVRAMAIFRWVLILGLLGAAVFTVGRHYKVWGEAKAAAASYRCPMHPTVVSDRPGTCPICGMDLVSIEASAIEPKGEPPWQCPLHPDYGGAKRGECPVCGETLVENPKAAPPGKVPVTLDATRTQQIGVRTAVVRRAEIAQRRRFAGTLAVDERRVVRVQTRYAGWLESVAPFETGAFVKKGAVLATIFSNDVQLAAMELLHALAGAEKGGAPEIAEVQRSLVKATRRRLAFLGLPAGEIDALAKTRIVPKTVAIRAPASGRVVLRGVAQGAYVQPGTDLFTLADLSRVWFLADVPEGDAESVRIGQRATIRLPAYPTRVFAARARFTYPVADSAARTLKVRFELSNPRGLLRPGLFGHAELEGGAREALLVPAEAVVDTGERAYVFVAKEGGRFEPRTIRTAGASGEALIVASGLDEGERVVTSAGFLIDAESQLRAAAAGLAGPAAEPPRGSHEKHDSSEKPGKHEKGEKRERGASPPGHVHGGAR